MSQFQILFMVETGWPLGRKRKRGESELTGMDWRQSASMPVLPRKGDWIALGDDDFRRVDDVYIAVRRDPDRPESCHYEVHFEFDAEVAHASMRGVGWEEA